MTEPERPQIVVTTRPQPPTVHMGPGEAYLIALTGLAVIPFEVARRMAGIVGRILVAISND